MTRFAIFFLLNFFVVFSVFFYFLILTVEEKIVTEKKVSLETQEEKIQVFYNVTSEVARRKFILHQSCHRLHHTRKNFQRYNNVCLLLIHCQHCQHMQKLYFIFSLRTCSIEVWEFRFVARPKLEQQCGHLYF